MERVLITGGSGYLGSVLAEHLLVYGYNVTVIDNLYYNQISLLHLFQHENFKFVKGDVRNEKLLKVLVENHDVIIPLAAIVGMPACKRNPVLAKSLNHKQIQNIISFCKKGQKIILPNTNSQYGHSEDEITEDSPFKPLSIYAETKCAAENDLLNSGNGIALRLATVFGVSPRMRLDLLVNDFTYKSCTDGYLVLFESNFKRNYIHVLDIARTFRFMIENYDKCNNNAFNVGLSDSNINKMELALKIQKFIPSLVIKEEEFRKDVDQRNYNVSNKKLESFGWEPKYSLDFGIKQLIDSYSILINYQNKQFTNL